MVRQKINIGDVFSIPITESKYGVGQIAGNWKGELYIVIYDEIHVSPNFIPAIVDSAKPKFAALSLDAKLYNGDWQIVGNYSDNLDRIPQPFFKVNQEGRVFVESRDRSRTWPASHLEDASLKFRTVVAPIRLEKALKAANGVGSWNSEYDELLAKHAYESAELVKLHQ